MRPTSSARRLLVPIIILIPLLGTGCAAGPAASEPAPPGSSEACAPPTGSPITVTELDDGRTVCAEIAQQIEFYLHGSIDRPWSPITAEGNPLSPNASGKLSLAVGVTGAVFSAVAPGTAEVTATRPTCASALSGPTCDSVTRFRVTVSVHS